MSYPPIDSSEVSADWRGLRITGRCATYCRAGQFDPGDSELHFDAEGVGPVIDWFEFEDNVGRDLRLGGHDVERIAFAARLGGNELPADVAEWLFKKFEDEMREQLSEELSR